MAIFEEKTIKPITVILILAAIFVFSYSLWHLGARELFWDEGNVATAIRELTVFPPAITLHGELSQSQYPLYPMLCKGFQMLTGASVEFSLRFVSVFFMAVLVALVGFNCYRADGIQAGAAGATVMLTSAIVAEKSIEGYPQTMVAAILYAGWILWIYFPLEKRRRELAWLSAGLFAGLAFYAAGFTGLIYFILPLIIQSRPLNMQLKMNLWSFWAAIGILLFFMMLWFVPRWQYSDLFLFADGVSQQNIADILKGYAAFPFRVLLGLFPWCFMLWAPFCSALQPLERNPLLNRYFTRLFVVLFVLIWLNPATLSRDILYLMPLLSSLIGLKYWIVVRRHGYRFLSFFSFLTWINMFLAVLAASLYFLPANLIDYIPFADGATFVKLQKMPGMAIALCGIVLSFLISGQAFLRCRRKERVWLAYGMIFTAAMLLFFAVVIPYRAIDTAKKDLANEFRNALIQQEKVMPDSTVLYKDTKINGLFQECWYMGFPVQTLALQKLPDQPDTLYVLTTDIPFGYNRIWNRVHDRIYKDNRLYLYKGVRIKEDEYNDERW